ncbi:uncharacterized protein LOC128397858 [Panonychus citri]|uniref:uncharacterized protein LOC128397858 n=1 Tax=Panonychus citri TaxID=50023 RepID=UPI002307AA03|nr:uncharacterized protein LOC128397858 [Panonychus citri]
MSVTESVPLNIAKRLLHKGRAGDKKTFTNDLHSNDLSGKNGDNQDIPKKQADEGKKAAATPAIVKRQQAIKNSEWYNSPTDNVLSPCSQRLWKPKKDNIAPMRLKLDDSPSKGNMNEIFEDESMEEDKSSQCLETSMEELNCSTTT